MKHRILPFVAVCAIFLAACAPSVILLSDATTPTPSATMSAIAPPAVRTALPAPTHLPDVGANPNALQGIEVTAWDGWDGSFARLFEQMAAEFSLSNQWGIKVKVISQRNLNLLASAVNKTLQEAERPDIVVALPEQILGWRENVIDLGPYLAQPKFGLEGQTIGGAFWEQSNVSGARYGVPAARSARFLFYNTSFAGNLGFTSAPQTADEFRQQACAANGFWKKDKDLTNDGYGGLALDVNSNWQTPFSWLAADDAAVYSDGEIHFDSPESIAALEIISTLRKDGCAWSAIGSSNYDPFVERRALFITGNLSEFAEQKQAFSAAKSSDAWTVLAFPGKTRAIVGYGPDYAVLKTNASRQLAAWMFIHWMLETKNQVRWSRETGMFPVTPQAIEALKQDGAADPQWAAALALIPLAKTYPQSEQWQLADKTLADGFMAYIQNYPNATLSGIFKVMDETIKDLSKK